MERECPPAVIIPEFALPFPATHVIAWRRQDKGAWGQGTWMSEPDKVQWVDPETQLDCLINRNHDGCWCGYVGVPEEHPWFGKGYDDVDADVHGGLTFADGCRETADPGWGICHLPAPGRSDSIWWLGFDCHHSGDEAPGMRAYYRSEVMLNMMPLELSYDRLHREDVYRDLTYVTDEVRSLACQARAAG